MLFILFPKLSTHQRRDEMRRKRKIYNQRKRIHNRRDKGICNHSGIQVAGFCKQRQKTSDKLCNHNDKKKRCRNDKRNNKPIWLCMKSVNIHHLKKNGRHQSQSAQKRYAKFLPNDAKDITDSDLPKGKPADNDSSDLSTRIASRIHDHRDKCR